MNADFELKHYVNIPRFEVDLLEGGPDLAALRRLPRKQAAVDQDLEAVADPQHEAAPADELAHAVPEELAHLVVMRRPDARVDYGAELAGEVARRETQQPGELLARPAGGCISLTVTALDISASAIRWLVAAGRSPAFLTPDPVVAYMRREGLYSGPDSA